MFKPNLGMRLSRDSLSGKGLSFTAKVTAISTHQGLVYSVSLDGLSRQSAEADA